MVKKRADIINELYRLLEPFNHAHIKLTPQTDISTDLNIDSMTVMDFIMGVEDHFNIDIPLNILSEVRTVSELSLVVEGRIKKE